ncbi:MAG: ribonuclease, partial [Mycobacterium sp.]|uniref:ribonuclease E/G n=1 Tax=Mycobacterium sp. TaxID=1785 RepID=UPI0028BA7C03
RRVDLPSGGYLMIDYAEAMTVIDVNSGSFIGRGKGARLEDTIAKTNLEAAEEVVRQLRLRDIGGIVVVDFIDMVLESNRDLVLRRLTEALARDRTRHQVSEVTSLGLVQLTRKRLGTGLLEAFSSSCPNCGGRGILLHGDPVDSGAAPARKSESGGRRGKRSKKGRSEEPADQPTVAKVPVHAPGEHPMFKAMAAGSSGPHDNGESGEADEVDEENIAEIDEQTTAAGLADLDDTDSEDFEDSDDDTDQDTDDVDEADSVDDELDDEDLDDDDDDDDDDDEDLDDEDLDDDDDDEDLDDEDSDDESALGRPRRRRAAGRPAGPPIHAD